MVTGIVRESSFDGFSSLYDELEKFFNQVSGIILVGDLNIHHRRWLKFSRESTNIGAEMKTLCDFHGLIQMVKEPTRNDYLLDLVITDIGGSVAKVLPKIADHNAVLVKVPKLAVKELEVEREVWMLKKAKWSSIKKELMSMDWRILQRGTAEDALNQFQTSV